MLQSVLRSLLIGGAAISALAMAQPALAYTQIKVTGTVGAHKVRDSEVFPAGGCEYAHSSANHAWKLTQISAEAPQMKAVPGMGTETVAWTFTVQRRLVGVQGPATWVDRYTSPKFKSSTDSAHNAPFGSDRHVKVIVPYPKGSDVSAQYRVLETLYWYKSDGTSILGSVTGRDDWYYVDSNHSDQVPKLCEDYTS